MVHIAQSAIVFFLLAATIFMAGRAFLRLFQMVNTGSRVNNFGQVSERISGVIRKVLGHQGVLEEKRYGFMHVWYLYGFLILGIGHMELVINGLTRFVDAFGGEPFLYRHFLSAPIIKVYEVSQDFMAGMVVLVVTIALYLRLTGKTKRLMPRSKDAERILWFIMMLYVSFFMLIGSESLARMVAGELTFSWHWYLPISSAIALMLQGFGEGTFVGLVHHIGWWLHLCTFLGFAVYIPRSKHLHLVAAAPNIYFRNIGAVAKPSTIDFETAEKYGVDRVQEFSWKSLLDTLACTECGRCDEVCPATITFKPLKPKKVLYDIKMNLRDHAFDEIKLFRNFMGRPLKDKIEAEMAVAPQLPIINREPGNYTTEGTVHLDEIWACTTCGACVDVCPVEIDSVPTSIIEMRRNLVLMEAKDYPKELNAAFRGMENQQNPWGVGADKRADWAKELDVPLIKDQGDREVEYLFWVGCAGATDDRAKKIQQALVRILKASNVDFAIMGCDEKCTGDPARRAGNEYLYDSMARENVAALNKLKFKKIFATCPHCFNALKNEYKDFDGHYTVQHHTELLAELMKDKRIPIDTKKEIKETITFHDPCYLGRYNNQYDAPRDVLSQLPGVSTTEMDMNKRKSFCCGAGGARMFMEEPIGKRINHERTEQAQKTGANTVATGCPFCMTMMSDGTKDKGLEETLQVKDVAEIVAERLI